MVKYKINANVCDPNVCMYIIHLEQLPLISNNGYEKFLAFAVINIGIQTASTKLTEAFFACSSFVCCIFIIVT